MTSVVCEASPLMILAKAGLLEILPKLFNQVLLPQGVLSEINAGSGRDPLVIALPHCDWLKTVEVESSLKLDVLQQLGRGEAEVIEFARLNGTLSVFLDDRAARRAADALGLKVHGTIGVMAAAAKGRHVRSFSDAV